jgi:hypothetical protein
VPFRCQTPSFVPATEIPLGSSTGLWSETHSRAYAGACSTAGPDGGVAVVDPSAGESCIVGPIVEATTIVLLDGQPAQRLTVIASHDGGETPYEVALDASVGGRHTPISLSSSSPIGTWTVQFNTDLGEVGQWIATAQL